MIQQEGNEKKYLREATDMIEEWPRRWFRLSVFGGKCCRMVLASTFCYIFQVTDSLACVVMQSLRHAPRRRCLKAQ